MISNVSELVFSLVQVSCLSNNAASTSVPASSSFHQHGNLKLLITVVTCHHKRKLFFRGWRLLNVCASWTAGIVASREAVNILLTISYCLLFSGLYILLELKYDIKRYIVKCGKITGKFKKIRSSFLFQCFNNFLANCVNIFFRHDCICELTVCGWRWDSIHSHNVLWIVHIQMCGIVSFYTLYIPGKLQAFLKKIYINFLLWYYYNFFVKNCFFV